MTWKPHATVAVVVEDDQGRFLLVEEVSGGKVVFNQLLLGYTDDIVPHPFVCWFFSSRVV